ncbi:MAG: hypothetical protein AAF657_15750 [Acidobacteriota bacterium]
MTLRSRWCFAALALLLLTFACSSPPSGTVAVPGTDDAVKTAATLRAERRAFDGAPPVIPHQNFGIACSECHDREGMEVEGTGFAPPSPHAVPRWPAFGVTTTGMSAISRCQQCHVFDTSDELFVANTFVGLPQDLRRGERLNPFAPPTLPHKTFMRENCTACHSGPAAREEIRTDHPQRARCRQCHVPVETRSTFPQG